MQVGKHHDIDSYLAEHPNMHAGMIGDAREYVMRQKFNAAPKSRAVIEELFGDVIHEMVLLHKKLPNVQCDLDLECHLISEWLFINRWQYEFIRSFDDAHSLASYFGSRMYEFMREKGKWEAERKKELDNLAGNAQSIKGQR